jgi:hypothetical protein
VRLDYWIGSGGAGGLGSSLSDRFGRLPARVLHEAGPVPRPAGSARSQFLTARVRGIIAVGFVHAGTVLPRRDKHRVRRKQVLGGLTHEYYAAA